MNDRAAHQDKEGRDFSITIVICNYNYAKYVGEAVLSATSQTYSPIEVIVVDDGSTDDSRAEIAKFPGIKTICKSNGGQTSGVRAALEECSGDIIVLLDSDDFLLPHACEAIVRNWRPELALLQFRLEKRDEGGAIVGYYPDTAFLHGGERRHVLKYGFIPSSPTSGNAFASWHVRNAFRHNRNRDRMYTDGYLIFTAPLYGEVLSLEDVLGVYRLHGGNVSNATAGNKIGWLKNYFATNYAHREGLAHHAALLGISNKPATAYLGPYEWRAALQLKRLAPQGAEVSGFSDYEIAVRGIWGFLRHPRLSLFQRVKNIIAMIVMTIAPTSIVRRLL